MNLVSNVAVDWKQAFPNFTKKEVQCKCGCRLLPELEFMMWLQKLRNIVNFPFIITSGARCPEYNNKVSGTGFNGPHTYGKAVDIAIYGTLAHKLITLATTHGAMGIGLKQSSGSPYKGRFIHLDIIKPNETHMPRPWVWTY